MTTEAQFQPIDTQKVNGTEDDNTKQEPNTERVAITSNASSEPRVRRSRFFHSKRKQRFQEEQTNQSENNDGDAESNERVDSSDSTQEPIEETPVENISSSNTHTTSTGKLLFRRLSSPPPAPTYADDTDETDGSTTSEESHFTASVEDFDTERQTYLTKKQYCEKPAFVQKKVAAPIIFSGYERKKSQSVKLTNADHFGSCHRKNVHFADDCGLDLSQIKVIKSDELPHVPSTAFKDLNIDRNDDETSFYQERMKTITYLEQQFENPIHAQAFDDRVARHKIALEQANAIDNRIYGTAKIISFGVNKRVKVRFTTDNWISYHDNNAIYIMDSYDGLHDRFTFTLDIDRDRICVGNNIQFCIGYESYVGPEYWDNNYQQNYRFDCISRTIPDYSG
ncbi:unnamed protein product [Rotaria socialis]|uniref:CBM21 domain-containing protein n=1 Tax=Rotaria socialis TaxID=392032 RepID=A0A820XVC4_9BILA|nr:unnamed protein product [Rotaria socialis]CAF4535107.1 unnamed protein product [Rotaria socialis]